MGKFFESAEDRDGTLIIIAVFALICGVLYFWKDQLANDIQFVLGTLLGLFTAIVQKYFKPKDNGKNGNGIQAAWLADLERRRKEEPSCPEPAAHTEPKKTAENKPIVPASSTSVASGAVESGVQGDLLDTARQYVDKVDESTPAGGMQIAKWAKILGFTIPQDGNTPWCAIFCGAMLHEAGYEPMKTMRARDYATYGEEVGMDAGEPGDIWVAQAHVAIIEGVDADGYRILGGNQSDQVCVHKASWYGQPIAIRRPV